jgi:hypothetical protein
LKRKLAAFLHLFGLTCLRVAVFLELLVLSDIISHGYFLALIQTSQLRFSSLLWPPAQPPRLPLPPHFKGSG